MGFSTVTVTGRAKDLQTICTFLCNRTRHTLTFCTMHGLSVSGINAFQFIIFKNGRIPSQPMLLHENKRFIGTLLCCHCSACELNNANKFVVCLNFMINGSTKAIVKKNAKWISKFFLGYIPRIPKFLSPVGNLIYYSNGSEHLSGSGV